jgi:ferredoxin-NADP reductase
MNATIKSVRYISDDIIEVTFRLDDEDFSFYAGQYITLILPGLEGYPVKDQSHDFSITSSPLNRRTLQIVSRISNSIFKTKLTSLRPGQHISLTGPKGVLTLPDITTKPIVLIAGGVGITPFLSMLRYVTQKKLEYNITLYYFSTDPKGIPFKEDLKKLEKQNPSLKVYFINGKFRAMHLHPKLYKNKGSLWYIAGPPAMIKNSQLSLERLGIVRSQFRLEGFTGYENHY